MPGPGRYRLGDAELSLELQRDVAPAALPRTPDLACFTAAALTPPLHLRRPRPGDRLKVRGLAGQRKVSDLLIDHKVPRPERARVVLLCQGAEVLWVAGHRASALGCPADRDEKQDLWVARLHPRT